MGIVKPKYRGTSAHRIISLLLIGAARSKTTVTYQDIAAIMGLPPQGNLMGKEVGYLLGEISDDEHDKGRPLLSAVVVGTSKHPGDGFFAFGRQLGKLTDDTPDGKRRFWQKELEAVYATWGGNNS